MNKSRFTTEISTKRYPVYHVASQTPSPTQTLVATLKLPQLRVLPQLLIRSAAEPHHHSRYFTMQTQCNAVQMDKYEISARPVESKLSLKHLCIVYKACPNNLTIHLLKNDMILLNEINAFFNKVKNYFYLQEAINSSCIFMRPGFFYETMRAGYFLNQLTKPAAKWNISRSIPNIGIKGQTSWLRVPKKEKS